MFVPASAVTARDSYMTQLQRKLRLPEVLQVRRCSKSQHYADIRAGRFPKPVKIGPRISAWPESDVLAEQRAKLAERDKAQA
jgi:prophage regulatory protein